MLQTPDMFSDNDFSGDEGLSRNYQYTRESLITDLFAKYRYNINKTVVKCIIFDFEAQSKLHEHLQTKKA
ncbi:MAG: hypothetical protein GY760_15050 [Deltaproteobacteria bacterium]|nr:hypothetical protein [Deltaproteobacteria bacterium]